MENQSIPVTPQPNSNKQIWLPVTIAVALTALVVGFGVYMWQNNVNNQEKAILEQQISDLNNQNQPLAIATTEIINQEKRIWEQPPIDCKNDLNCLAQAAQACTSAQGQFSSPIVTVQGKNETVKYKMGIQGHASSGCRMFFKRLESQSSDNYTTCTFQNDNDLVVALQKREFISDIGRFELYQEPIPHYSCDRYEVLDPVTGRVKIESNLVSGEAFEDASENIRIEVTNIDWLKSADFLLLSGNKQMKFSLNDKEEKQILGYTVKLAEFGQKNISNDSDSNPDNDVFGNMVSLTIAK